MKQDRLPVFSKRLLELKGNRNNIEFAECLGISRQTVGFYLNGERVPDAENIKLIAEKCNVSADWLLGLSDVRRINPEIASVCAYTGLSENAVMHLRTNENARNIINLLLENEYEIAQELLRSADDWSIAEKSFVEMFNYYLSPSLPNAIVYIKGDGTVYSLGNKMETIDTELETGDVYINGIKVDNIGNKPMGQTIRANEMVDRIMLDDVIKSLKLIRESYLGRKDAE